jgi:hypothetical protein
MQRYLTRANVRVSQLVIAGAAILLAVALETAFAGALRLPGHRALPGALVLLLLAETLAPVALFAVAAAVSSILVATGKVDPLAILVWTGMAGATILAYRKEIARSVVTFLALGLLFGLATWLAKSFGPHKTPEVMRAAGHCAFGAFGGLLAWGGIKAGARLQR